MELRLWTAPTPFHVRILWIRREAQRAWAPLTPNRPQTHICLTCHSRDCPSLCLPLVTSVREALESPTSQFWQERAIIPA